jgi:hypothetical protein
MIGYNGNAEDYKITAVGLLSIRCPGRDSNRTAHEYKSQAQPLEPTCSVGLSVILWLFETYLNFINLYRLNLSIGLVP